MTQLKRLTKDGRRLVGKSFLRGEQETIPQKDYEEFVEPVEATADLDALEDALGDVMDDHAEFEAAIDAAAAPHVHRHLDVSRRVAGDSGLWHYLTTIRFPGFVRYRWEFSSEEAMREKFLAAGTDIYSNALHRLWWIAELTHDGDDYSLTEDVLGNQSLANRVFDREFAQYRPAAVVLSEELLEADANPSTIDETTLRFNHALTNLQLEGLSEEHLREVVGGIIDDVAE